MDISVVVVAYDMGRELPRTVRSLSPARQRGLDGHRLELIVVDNGSPEPVDADALAAAAGGPLRVIRLDPAPPSPARAANVGVAAAAGELVGLVVDGARLASPGLVAGAVAAAGLADRPVVTAPGYHLGAVPHMRAADAGYDQAAEDELLAASGWEDDGYRLFAHCTFGGSSSRGWFGPMGESSSLFLPRGLWDELGGLDEAFALPGGGLVNHDLYRRACALPGATLVQLLGEGTFHQIHGGAATSRRFGWDEMHADYVARRGERYVPPPNRPIHLGRMPDGAVGLLEHSVRWLAEHR
ncbi:MAG TPA: glycosyltransferase [Aquihabitans sp.]|nr:glycosyltransferase [Aquihabitans sp.]